MRFYNMNVVFEMILRTQSKKSIQYKIF